MSEYYYDPSLPGDRGAPKGRGLWKPCDLCTCEDFPKCEGLEMCQLGELGWDEAVEEE